MNLNSDYKKYIFTNIFIVVVVSIITIILYVTINKLIKEEVQRGVSKKLSQTSISISDQLHYSVEDLISTSTILSFNEDISLDEFTNYAKNRIRKLDDDFLLEWQPIVLHKNRDNFEKKARELGLKNFYLWEPGEDGKPIAAKNKYEYIPVYYLLATHVDVNTLGLDLAFSPERMISKYLARDEGVAKSSDLFKRISNKKGNLEPISFAITLPVYKQGIIPTTIEKRKENIKGYLAGVYSISSIFDSLLEKLSKENYIISIYSKGNKDVKFIQNPLNKSPLYSNTTTIDVYGVKWEISLAVNEKYVEQNTSTYLYYLLIIPLLFGLMILIFFRTLHKKNTQLHITKDQLEKSLIKIKQLKDQQLKDQKTILTQTKVAAVGEMIGNIAHQWRQPLSIISMETNNIKVSIDLGEEISKEDLIKTSNNITEQINYLSKTIDDFRNFFSANSHSLQNNNLKDIFKKLEDITKSSLDNNFIEIIEDIEENIVLLVNDNILVQAFINIYNNAKDAIVENVKDTESRYIFVDVKKVNDKIVIVFKDNGGGIKEDIIDKIFEPYFTTKHQSIGTGIGLYMTNQIITKHLKGSIEVLNVEYVYKNKKYKGAKFKIELPINTMQQQSN